MNINYYIIIQPDGSLVYSHKIEYTFLEKHETVLYILKILALLYFTSPLVTITIIFIILF